MWLIDCSQTSSTRKADWMNCGKQWKTASKDSLPSNPQSMHISPPTTTQAVSKIKKMLILLSPKSTPSLISWRKIGNTKPTAKRFIASTLETLSKRKRRWPKLKLKSTPNVSSTLKSMKSQSKSRLPAISITSAKSSIPKAQPIVLQSICKANWCLLAKGLRVWTT